MKARHWAIAATMLLSLLPCVAQSDRGSDWPSWRGSKRNGISHETAWTWHWKPEGPRVRWRASVGAGFSSFAVADGRVYTLGNTAGIDTVFCFDAETGKILWQHSYPCDPQPLSYEGGPAATPAVDGTHVFTFSKGGDLFCFDTRTGDVVWSKKFEPWPQLPGDWVNTWRYSGSPLVQEDRLVMSVGQGGLALSKKEGAVIWESAAGHPGYSSPVPFHIPQGKAIAFFSGHAVVGALADSGQQLWQVPWNTEWDLNAADPIIHGGKMFVSSGNGVGCALFDITVDPPVELWRNKHIKNMMSSSILWQGNVFGFNNTHLTCISWETGDLHWRTRDVRKGCLTLAAGKLVLLGETGKLVVAEATAQDYKPLAQAQILDGRCWTTPVLAGGCIYARNAAGQVVSLDLRTGKQ